MPKGARKGEIRKLAPDVPPQVRARMEEQIATALSYHRSKVAGVSAGRRGGEPLKSDPLQVYDIEPKKGTPHVDLARRYVSEVKKGKVIACRYVQQAVERFDSLLKRKDIIFLPEKAERVCNFIESMPHAKGTWPSVTIKLEPWQCFIVTSIFAFYWRRDPTRRVVKSVYLELARKNAKSTLLAAIGLYMLTEDGEIGPEVYSAATTHKQALAIFDPARAMARRQMGFVRAHDIVVQKNAIRVWGTLGKFEALHAQGETLDGLNIYCALVDELHAHKTRAVYDVLETAMGSRINPLMIAITTAGSNRSGICYEVRDYTRRVLDGTVDDPQHFGMIFTLDDEDIAAQRFFDKKLWIKANPNLNVSVFENELERLAAKARAKPSALNAFLTKHLNIWVNASYAWMKMDAWDRCEDRDLSEDDFEGEECVIGLDLASKVDINAKVKLFRREIDGDYHYYAFGRYYLPQARIDEGENDSYAGWAIEGHLQVTPGNVIDLDAIEEDFIADASRHRVLEVAFDPYQATQLASHLAREGFTAVEIRPTVLNFSEPMKELERLVLTQRFHHNGDPVLRWMVSNVVARPDKKDNIYPTKEFPENKIDGVIALLMALNRWLGRDATDQRESVYRERGVRVLG